MTDIFLTEDLRHLLQGKHVMLLGDSNMRAIYKDLLCLHSHPKLIGESVLRSKMEKTCFGDRLLSHGQKTNGRDYKEYRAFTFKGRKFSFHFLTRVYSQYMEKIITDFSTEGCPDVIVANSCLWDICRWGPHGVQEYKQNLKILMKRFKETLDSKCLVIWLTTLPISQEVKGGFLLVQLEFLKLSLRFHVVEANHYARQIVVGSGYDILDGHYHLRMQLQQRAADGIHWLPCAVRHLTNLLLTHLSIAWGVKLPGRYKSSITERVQSVQDINTNELAYDEPDIDGSVKRVKKDEEEQDLKILKSKIQIPSEKPKKSILKDINNIKTSTSNSNTRICETPSNHRIKKKMKLRRYESQKRKQLAQQRIRKYIHNNPSMPSPVVASFTSPLGSPIRYMNPSSIYSPSHLLPTPISSPYSVNHSPYPYVPFVHRPNDNSHSPYSHSHSPYSHSHSPYSHMPSRFDVPNEYNTYGYNFENNPRIDWADTGAGRPFRFGDCNA